MEIYGIKDVKLGAFDTRVMTYENVDILVRDLTEAVAQAKQAGKLNMMMRYPQDFELYCLGEFDEKNGHVRSDGVKYICSMQAIVGRGVGIKVDALVEMAENGQLTLGEGYEHATR